ncbi:MAG: purine-nucleoside phosphorylase [Planctomycetaceae bacterium]|nr:purine-nucleoside phosphorylase [Planctomycetaceae bacterium]
MPELDRKIEEATDYLRQRWQGTPRAGIILGTGMGGLVKSIEQQQATPYQSVPHFPGSTSVGHEGRLIFGRLNQVPVIAMQGRFHLYEGYTTQQVTLPVRVMKSLGIETLIVSNAAGGMNPRFSTGDIMVIEDHVNFMWKYPSAHLPAHRTLAGFRKPGRLYDQRLRDSALEIARAGALVLQQGVYVGLPGPSYETRAEYRFLRHIGDVVGMSTIPEVTAAVQCGIRVLGFSTITNMCLPDAISGTTADEVAAIADQVEPRLSYLVTRVLQRNN